MSSTEKKTLEILLENIFLQKELISKEEILSTLIKTQTTILESVPYQNQKTESNDFVNQLKSAHQSPNKVIGLKSTSLSHFLNRTPSNQQM